MDEHEKAVLKANHLPLIEDLDIKVIAPVLIQNSMFCVEQYEELCSFNRTRRQMCHSFLLMLNQPNSKCTFTGFIQALRHEHTYSFLADMLETSLHDFCQDDASDKLTDMKETPEDKGEIIFEPIRKVDVFTASRRKMLRLAHELKRLSHDGQSDKFCEITSLIHQRFLKQKTNLQYSVVKKMELADMQFTALDAETSAKREKYDVSLCGSDVFREMLEVIPFTTNPRVSSMTYLARYGSSISMMDGIEAGLNLLNFAKEHAEYVSPCRDTGMVFYIEVNLLMQMYEATPRDDLKYRVLETTQYAMAQFEGEGEEVRNDYQRMLMLKMVFCYLGIGLFGKKIQHIKTTSNDKDAAKKCLDFIEKPEVWNGLEKRRKMLFLLAKTEYYRQIGCSDLAKIYAKESHTLARKNGWNAELPNIENIVRELERRDVEAHMEVDDDIVKSLIDDLTM